MIVQAQLSEICTAISFLSDIINNPNLKTSANILSDIGVFKDVFTLKKPILNIGFTELKIAVSAIDGCLELNIISAKVLGLSLFGIVRVKAATIILGLIKPYSPMLTMWKNKRGNLSVSIPGVEFLSANIILDTLIVEFITVR